MNNLVELASLEDDKLHSRLVLDGLKSQKTYLSLGKALIKMNPWPVYPSDGYEGNFFSILKRIYRPDIGGKK